MKVMLLIDVDNVTSDVVKQAFEHVLQQHGAAHIRRAYGTVEAAAKQQKLFKELGIRPMVNMTSGKNCTDIALAIDAIDLAIAERPDLAVVVSSDSDFAPLVLRLREKGCRVEGIGQEGKTADDTRTAYDAFVEFPARKARSKAPAARAEKPPKRDRPARAGKAAAPAPPLPEDVQQVLDAMPSLRDGAWVELRDAAGPLRAAGLLRRNVASTKVFRKHPTLFELHPDQQPAKVRYLAGRA